MDQLKNIYEQILCCDVALEDDESGRIDVNRSLHILLIIAAGSYFESRLQDIVVKSAEQCSTKPWVPSFILKKGLKRQYHSLFDWESNNANKLVSLLGQEVKDKLDSLDKTDPTYRQSMQSFMSIGNDRNLAAHAFGNFNPTGVPSETWAKVQQANTFLDHIQNVLISAQDSPTS